MLKQNCEQLLLTGALCLLASRTYQLNPGRWCADIKIEADERLRAFVQAWRNEQHSQFPPEAHEQRMAIDSLHADLIHMQEEKNLFAQQVGCSPPPSSKFWLADVVVCCFRR